MICNATHKEKKNCSKWINCCNECPDYKFNTHIDFTRVNSDINGNPRYVCHFFNLLKDNEKQVENYGLAVKRANKIGGCKFHNKQYGGGIVFHSYSLPDTEKSINNLLEAI